MSEPDDPLGWLFEEPRVHFVWEHGWEVFETLLEAKDPALWDLQRASMVEEPA